MDAKRRLSNDSKMSWNARAIDVLAQGCTTFSKRITSYGWDSPTHVLSSNGVQLTCDDGKDYYDMGGMGSQLISCTNNFSLPSYLEVEVAEKIRDRVPVMQKMKILKTGSAALECAIRFARDYCKRSGIIWSGYHGVNNAWISCEKPGAGTVYEHSIKFTDDHKLLAYLKGKHYKSSIGIVCMEPVLLDDSTEREELVKEIIKVAHSKDMIVILDEVVTGWRVPKFTYTNNWGLDADIVCLGKATADGHPIGICGGRKDIMSGDSFISNTANGEESTLKVMSDVLSLVTEEKLDDFWTMCGMVKNKANNNMTAVQLTGLNTRWAWKGDPEIIALYWQEMLEEGFICSSSMFPKFNQMPVILEKFITALGRCSKRLCKCRLRGVPPQPVFKRY